MIRKLGPALLVVVGLFSGSAASASPLTFYTDEAAWLAAVSGFKVGTYPFDVAYSDTLINVALLPNGFCCVISTPPPIGFLAPVLGANFTSLDITFSSGTLDVCIYPSCILTFATDVTVNFPTPIYGFASFASGRQEFAAITFNGQAISTPGLGFGPFLGVTGLINSLDISCEGCDPKHDEYVDLMMSGIVVATVDEPSGFASPVTDLVLLAVASSRFRRRAVIAGNGDFVTGR